MFEIEPVLLMIAKVDMVVLKLWKPTGREAPKLLQRSTDDASSALPSTDQGLNRKTPSGDDRLAAHAGGLSTNNKDAGFKGPRSKPIWRATRQPALRTTAENSRQSANPAFALSESKREISAAI
jgi:hypothetical protein